MFKTRILAATAACALLAACANTPISADVTKVETAFNQAVTAYNDAKTAALLLAITEPSLASTISAVEAKVDPLVVQAQTAEQAAAVDVPAFEALVSQIQSQVATLTGTSAKTLRMAAVRR